MALWGYFAAVVLFTAGFAVFWGPIPAFLRASYPDSQIFWLFLAANAGSAAFYSHAGMLSTRFGARAVHVRALAARGVLFPLVGIVAIRAPAAMELPLLLGVFGLIGLTWAMIAITASGIVSRRAGPALGTALGVYTALAGLGGGIGSIVGGWVATTIGYHAAFALAGATVVVSVVVVLRRPPAGD